MSSIGTPSVSTGSFIPEIVDQHRENSSSLWLQRAYAVAKTSHQLNDLVALDERIEANIDGLRVALRSGWRISHADLQKGEAADFFCTGVLALESGPSGSIEELIDLAQRTAIETVSMPYHCAYDPWRGLVSAFAWIDRAHVPGMIDRLTSSSDPCRHWLGVATCGVRRILDHPSLAAALGDTERLVRTRAARAVGELGRTDLLKDLSVLRLTRDPECRFWSAWAAARMGAAESLDTLADIAWNNLPRADRALDLLLRRLDVPQANAWLREFAKLPDRKRSLIRATGVVGDPLYIPWLIEHMAEPATARLAGEALSMITGLDLAYRDLDRRPPADFQSGPNDDPEDENVALAACRTEFTSCIVRAGRRPRSRRRARLLRSSATPR
jgi:uncharacterized protein (TIGR02270 family)